MSIKKCPRNPILTNRDVPFRANSIFNAGAIKFNNMYLLLARVEMPRGRSSFVIARSEDGENFKVDNNICLGPEDHKNCYDYVEWGIEDPRIIEIEKVYYICYTGYSRYMPVVILAKTTDFEKFEVIGPITEASNKDAVLFPEKIDGYYWKIDRPTAEERRDIWINRSPDLIHWGDFRILLAPVPGTWEGNKIGASTPPVKTDKGWILMYHGVRSFGMGVLYKQGVAILDLHQPWKVTARCEEPVLYPEEHHERIGDVGNVVFSNGWVIEDNGDIKIYYSGADTNICLATTSLDYLVSICKPV